MTLDIPLPKKKKPRLSQTITNSGPDSSVSALPDKKKKKSRSLRPNSVINNINSVASKLQVTPMTATSKLKKKHRLTTGGTPGGTPNSLKKRVNFVLAKNLEHDATDYIPSISRSPAIPFDANRTPTFGVLKTPGSSTPASAAKSFAFNARKRALEFF